MKKILLSVVPFLVFATSLPVYAGEGEYVGGFRNAKLEYWMDDSVTKNKVKDIVEKGANAWNDLIPEVELDAVSKKSSSDIRVYASYYNQRDSGWVEPYYKNAKGDLVLDDWKSEEWEIANLRLNLQYWSDEKYKSDDRLKTVTHEFGHTLSLSHSDNSNSVMIQGRTSVIAPTKHDIGNLKDKWSND